MKISIAVVGDQARSPIPENLRQATHLFIVDTERFEVLRVLTADEPTDRDVAFARRTIDENCEAIICGEIEKRAFDLLAEACVSRYNGTGFHASQATKLIKGYRLPLIRDHIGGQGCAGERSGGECHESSLK
jgi:predicted Fe-Mo cluster-binding NifX family protein